MLSRFVFVVLSLVVTAAWAEVKTISVLGESVEYVEPNLVTFNVEIWSKGSSAKNVQAMTSSETKRVFAVLESAKIRKEDIQTTQYSLNPEYIYDQRTQSNKMVGFRSLHQLVVKVKKIEEIGGLLDKLVVPGKSADYGVNVNSINWDSDKRESLLKKAMRGAVLDAEAKAKELASSANIKIKGVYKISYSGSGSSAPVGGVFKMAMAAESAPQLSPGQIEIRAQVNVDYEL